LLIRSIISFESIKLFQFTAKEGAVMPKMKVRVEFDEAMMETRVFVSCPLYPLSLGTCNGEVVMPTLHTFHRQPGSKGYVLDKILRAVDPSKMDPRLGLVGICPDCGFVVALTPDAQAEVWRLVKDWVEESNTQLEAESAAATAQG
jgi:hypothetical protein